MKRLPRGRQTNSRKLIAARKRTPDVLSESPMRDPHVRFLGADTKVNFIYARRERNWNPAQEYG
jgi:hypothetical protein